MSYRDRFSAYKDTAELHCPGYIYKPESLRTLKDVQSADTNAAQIIGACKALIADMQEYRLDLAKRYNDLATMPFKETLTLERYVNYDGKKIYYIRRIRIYADGTKVETDYERFPGAERAKALKRFDELLKAYPGIEFTKDIAKRSWEK